jgi:octaprenyl-diphosphate synthase
VAPQDEDWNDSLAPNAGLVSPLSPQEIKTRVYALAAPADKALADNLDTHLPFIDEVSRYILFSGGKRLRPVLFMLACKAAGAEPDVKLSSIFEFLHAATLLHDDVVDDAGLRRGRVAARTKYGNEGVILVGDFLFSKSYTMASIVDDIRFVRALTGVTTYMAEGQVLELLHTNDLELDLKGYSGIIRAKTAILLAAACQMGGIYAGAPDHEVDALYEYGIELGIAFQMVDDALDYVGTEHEFGKPVGHDLAEGKITLPFIHVRDQAEPKVRQRLMEAATKAPKDAAILEEAREIIRSQGGVDATYAQAARHAQKAQAALKRLNPGFLATGEADLLMSLPWYVLNRRD